MYNVHGKFQFPQGFLILILTLIKIKITSTKCRINCKSIDLLLIYLLCCLMYIYIGQYNNKHDE